MKKPLAPAIIAAVAASSLLAPTALAQDDQATQCPAMHWVVVHDAADSTAQTDQHDAGFLGQVVAPVLQKANGENSIGTTGGFEPEQQQETQAQDDWRPNVWGNTETSEAPTTTGDWRPNVWGNTTAETEAISEEAEITTTENAATPVAESGSADVTRTYISLKGATSQGFIPGVHGSANEAYNAAIEGGIEDTDAVLSAVHQACPATKVVLMGHKEGAQVVSAVAKKIGNGESEFPADNVSGVALFADPTRSENQPVAKTPDLNVEGPSGAGVITREQENTDNPTDSNAPGVGGSFGDLQDRTVSWCLDGDASCAMEKGTPLDRINATNTQNLNARDPQRSLTYLADHLGPAVLLGTAETLAEDIDFGPSGFTFKRAANVDSTLLGRVATEMETKTPQSEREDRLRVAAMSLGGMGLAAGITIAKKVVTPENIATIVAASSASPAAAAAMAGVVIGKAALETLTPATATTAALRVMDETEAAGLETPEVAEAAVEAAVYRAVSGEYSNTPVTETGQSPTDATTQWLTGLVADQLGDKAPAALLNAETTTTTPAAYDQDAINTAVANMKEA